VAAGSDDTATSDAAGISIAATIATRTEIEPEPIHRLRQPAPDASMTETAIAEITIPKPTPAKWMAESWARPDRERRSSTSVDAHTITKALAIPPVNRRAANEAISDGTAMAPVETALTANAVRSQNLGRRITNGRPASSAPTR
jgi:hypothetical protein